MEKAIIVSIITIFVFIGIERTVQWLLELVNFHGKRPAVIFYEISDDADNAELIIRSLTAEIDKLKTCKGTLLYIVTDAVDEQTFRICSKTAEQFNNVYVGKFQDAKEFVLNRDT